MTEATAVDLPPRKRVTAFRLGVAFGLLLCVAVGALLAWMMSDMEDGPRFVEQVITIGEDLTRHGAAKVVVSGDGVAFTQTCNGPCDDLWVNTTPAGYGFSVRVFDAAGGLIVRGTDSYVVTSYGMSASRWIVFGEDLLKIRRSWLTREPNGVITEHDARFTRLDPDNVPRWQAPPTGH